MKATPSVRAAIVEARTYLRPLNPEGTMFETVEQAADRIISHQRWLWERAKGGMIFTGSGENKTWELVPLSASEEAELQELRALFLDRKITVSGRTRWLGGTEIARTRESSNFNCSFIEIRTVHDVVDALWLLLQGCGVGFRPVPGVLNGFKRPIADVRVIRTKRGPNDRGPDSNEESYDPKTGVWTIRVGDSAQAWARSIGKLLAGKYDAKRLVLDFSNIRGAGGRLRSYGWISSGDEQIAKAYVAIAKIMSRKAGKLLSAIDILDILNWLGTILSSRRSAEIAVLAHGDPEWREFATAKKDHFADNPQRAQSNNSLMFTSRPTRAELEEVFALMLDAGGSEPGFINAVAAKKRAPWFSGINPCVPGSTPILTKRGYVPIIDLVGKKTEIWNGNEWSTVTPFSTGVNPLVRVTLSDGTHLDCTPEHKWVVKSSYQSKPVRVSAQELLPGTKLTKFSMPILSGGEELEDDAYSQGFYAGDGNTDLEHSWVYAPKYAVIPRLKGVLHPEDNYGRRMWVHGPMRNKTWVPHSASLQYRLDWLAGLCDADGTVVSDVSGCALQISSCEKDFLLEVRRMLTTLGCQAKLNLMNEEGKEFDGYTCRACWRLLIPTMDVFRLLSETNIRFSRLGVDYAPPQRDARRFVTVVSVDPLPDPVETFCFTEPKNNTGTFNGIVTGQCAEILLGDKSFCNLVETALHRFNGDWAGLVRAHWLVARANYRQTCVDLRDSVLQEAWHQLNEYLRLCGAGVTGVVSWEHANDASAWKGLNLVAHNGAHGMALQLGMQPPAAVTTIKPSGTQSKTMGIEGLECPEGVHKPLGRFIFNRIRFNIHDPLVAKLAAADYQIEEDPYDETGCLVVMPVEFHGIDFEKVELGGEIVEVNQEPAVAQLERYKLTMENYVDHNTSITISYSPDEVPAIIDWLLANWDVYVGVSFILRTDPTKSATDLGYPYLPQTVVSETTFRAYVAKLKPVDLTGLASTTLLDADECQSGVCPVR